jgi:HEAT repeat protein
LVAIGNSRQTGNATIRLLASALHAENRLVRKAAAQALGWIGPEGVPVLVQELRSTDPGARVRAAWSLQYADHSAMRVAPLLLRLAGDDDADVRAMVMYALGCLGRSVDAVTMEQVRQALRNASKEADGRVR